MTSFRTALQALFGPPAPVAPQIAFHGPVLAELDAVLDGTQSLLARIHADQPRLFPTFHARCGDCGGAA
jgi:hypothetical protein